MTQPITRPQSLSITLALIFALAAIHVAAAQAPAALVITILDQVGAGVPGIAVVVLDRTGSHELSRGITDAQGVLAVATLPTDSIRVTVSGQLRSGAQLSLPGEDTAGILIDLAAPPTRLDLRVEPDGQVRPDPATMIVPDLGIPAEDAPVFPTAIRVKPSATTTNTATALSEPAQLPAPIHTPQGGWWLGLVVLTSLVAAIVVVVRLRTTRGRV